MIFVCKSYGIPDHKGGFARRLSLLKNLIMECCMEFMRMISDETSQLCAKEGKSTIGADHVLRSLESLGFHAWKTELDAALLSHKEVCIDRLYLMSSHFLEDLQEEAEDEQESDAEQRVEV
eukprot:761118-Hanusia_phi.AAC.3